MKFFLGTHQVDWLARSTRSLFISAVRLRQRKRLPAARSTWALDSGGFSELSKFGHWRTGAKQYAQEVKLWSEKIGNLEWAAIQDHMCEPFILKKTGRSLLQHQEATVQSYLDLKSLAPEIPWAPVLQGFELGDYLRCVELYLKAGISLRAESIVGVGSICRRQGTVEAVHILTKLAGLGLKLHGFGFKSLGLRRVSHLLASSDSMAWSFHARKNPQKRLAGCTHKTCANG